jgi:hypothetical protein
MEHWTDGISRRLNSDLSRIPIHPPQPTLLQTKLMVNDPDDDQERDADRVAEHIMRMPDPRQPTPLQSPVCRECVQAQPLQAHRFPDRDGAHRLAPPIVHHTLQSQGQPLDPTTREWMERRFVHDFSQVRVHADAMAAESARAVNARAYTVGHEVVFASGAYGPSTSAGRHLLAHELTHVVQQEGVRPLVMRDGPPLPRSLDHTLDPAIMSRADLDQEILALRDWLQVQTTGLEETHRLQAVLEAMEAESRARAGAPPIPPASGQATLPPPRRSPGSLPVPGAAPQTTMVAGPQRPELPPLEPNEMTRQRLEQIIREGGPMPSGSRARVIGAAIVEVDGYTGPRELRAISSMATDELGQMAPVAHAQTPTSRTLSPARSISGSSIRREFPFSHVNDAEIKLFEAIAPNMPANARGRISFLTMRSRDGGRILEPIPACSSCTNATFQFAGTFRGVQVGSYAAVFPAPALDLDAAIAERARQVPPASMGRPSGRTPTPARQTRSIESQTRAEIGTPSMAGLSVGGPSIRGEGIGAGLTLVFMGVNVVLNVLNDRAQEDRVRLALDQLEPPLRSQRQAHPEMGALLVFHYTQQQSPPESLIRPGASFQTVNYYMGRTQDEARDAWHNTPMLRAMHPSGVTEFTQTLWIPPVNPPSITDIRTPFQRVALATFAEGRAVFQNVQWGGVTGFDDEGTTPVTPGAQPARFLILRVPDTLAFLNGGMRINVTIPISQRGAQSGGSIPAVDMDPILPFTDVAAACVFPADDATDLLFSRARATQDNLGQLDLYTNFGKVRWVRPENIRVLQRL